MSKDAGGAPRAGVREVRALCAAAAARGSGGCAGVENPRCVDSLKIRAAPPPPTFSPLEPAPLPPQTRHWARLPLAGTGFTAARRAEGC